MSEITLPALIANIETATEFMNGILEDAGCPLRVQMQLDIALDELMSNVARYAYHPGTGDITVSVEILDDPQRVRLTLSDSGTPYDPNKAADPDVTLSAEERKIGGLGIFIVRKSMDKIDYEYKDGKNVLTIEKKFFR